MMQRIGMMTLALATAFGCGDDGGSTVTDGGPGPEILFEELYSDGCIAPVCPGLLLETACACVPAPLDDDSFEVNRVGCSELAEEGGVPRTPEADRCDGAGASAAPDLSCFMEGTLPTRGDVQVVTVYGVVEVFDSGGDTDDITVEIYEEGGGLLGSAIALVGDPAGPCAETEIDYEDDEPAFDRQLGFYQIPNIPSETPLVVRTSGDSRFWHDVYEYGVSIQNDEVAAAAPADACETVAALEGPLWEHRPQLMSAGDWDQMHQAAGLLEGIRSGSGVVTGEIRDCAGVRLEFANVGTFPIAAGRTYFNGDATNPRPEPGRSTGTNVLGLYAALDIPEGPVDVAAIGRLDGQTVSLGWYRAQVHAGAVTSLSLRGLRAHQAE